MIHKTNIKIQKGNFSCWWENKKKQDSFELAENEKLRKDINRLSDSAKRTSSLYLLSFVIPSFEGNVTIFDTNATLIGYSHSVSISVCYFALLEIEKVSRLKTLVEMETF
ncbi:ABC transporter, ATP-binding protein [Desulfosporosinus sp. I2]|nr:ABC transporter, ATP-binding protein [Desulfosporosinus sp. I2]